MIAYHPSEALQSPLVLHIPTEGHDQRPSWSAKVASVDLVSRSGSRSVVRKRAHEFRDPVHTFIRVDDRDRKVIDSAPVQRLRNIHQLAMSYLIYPGATHRRFEHSLGVMQLAEQAFDVVTNPDNLSESLKDALPAFVDSEQSRYWRRELRMAALCHDIGHLPFSHAQEGLLPKEWTHERITALLIMGNEMSNLWESPSPSLNPKHIAKIAVGPKDYARHVKDDPLLTDTETLLSELVVGDAFGADRIDYLLRDSLHAGVAYGKFDHHRLIDTLRILPSPGADDETAEPQLGVTEGGLHSAEALLLARYFMFTQVYLHPVRRIYDLHLGEFLSEWLENGQFAVDSAKHLAITDAEVISALRAAAQDSALSGHEPASRIVNRRHFKVIWEHNQGDVRINRDAGGVIYQAACEEFGERQVRRPPQYSSKSPISDFPVLLHDGRVVSAQDQSDVLQRIPTVASDIVYVEPGLRDRAQGWLRANLPDILKKSPAEQSDVRVKE